MEKYCQKQVSKHILWQLIQNSVPWAVPKMLKQQHPLLSKHPIGKISRENLLPNPIDDLQLLILSARLTLRILQHLVRPLHPVTFLSFLVPCHTCLKLSNRATSNTTTIELYVQLNTPWLSSINVNKFVRVKRPLSRCYYVTQLHATQVIDRISKLMILLIVHGLMYFMLFAISINMFIAILWILTYIYISFFAIMIFNVSLRILISSCKNFHRLQNQFTNRKSEYRFQFEFAIGFSYVNGNRIDVNNVTTQVFIMKGI